MNSIKNSSILPSEDLSVLVSPHPDDLALSMGGLIANKVPLRNFVGVTVFTRTNFAPYGNHGVSRIIDRLTPRKLAKLAVFQPRLTTLEVTRCRQKEELQFFKSIGIRHVTLGLFDATLRGYSFENLFAGPGKTDSDTRVSTLIRHSLLKILAGARTGRIFLPLGLGNHVDHILVRDTCAHLTANFDVIYYEELPYAAMLSLQEIDFAAHSLEPSLKPTVFDIKESFHQKLSSLRLYRSQISPKEIDLVTYHAKRVSPDDVVAERLWSRDDQLEI